MSTRRLQTALDKFHDAQCANGTQDERTALRLRAASLMATAIEAHLGEARRVKAARNQPLPDWTDALGPEQQEEVRKDLAADEFCACRHRDDQHDPDGACEVCPPGECVAYNPVQL